MLPPCNSSPTHLFPLRWESTGDQWWFASPIDLAAAKGHYHLVRELLYIDTNLLIKLTSLPRLRRLETLWDDDRNLNDVAKCRAQVARSLFLDAHNSLIAAGYGGWLLYTAAAAGDVGFVQELLDRDPLLVFGEGEYGVTDMLYAASRSKNSEVFRLLFRYSLAHVKEDHLRFEMANRAVHAAARGGNLEMLTELLDGGSDVLAYRDARGSTLLHTASGRGQVQVVEYLISSYKDIMTSVDNGGNTALNVAAYRGHLPALELLLSTRPSLASLPNNDGDTFLHTAVSGFQAPGFRRLDRHLHLLKRLLDGTLVDIGDMVNARNRQGRTALHLAVMDNLQSRVVALLMSLPCVDLNIRDADGNTPLDLLKQRPHSEVLIISAGGISDRTMRNAIVSHLRKHGMGGSPGTSFSTPDAEILLHTEDIETETPTPRKRLTSLVGNKDDRSRGDGDGDGDECPIPLRLQFSRASCNNKRIQPSYMLPSPSTKKKFTAGLTQGVLQLLSRPYLGSPASESSFSSPISAAHRTQGVDDGSCGSASASPSPKGKKKGSLIVRSIKSYRG